MSHVVVGYLITHIGVSLDTNFSRQFGVPFGYNSLTLFGSVGPEAQPATKSKIIMYLMFPPIVGTLNIVRFNVGYKRLIGPEIQHAVLWVEV